MVLKGSKKTGDKKSSAGRPEKTPLEEKHIKFANTCLHALSKLSDNGGALYLRIVNLRSTAAHAEAHPNGPSKVISCTIKLGFEVAWDEPSTGKHMPMNATITIDEDAPILFANQKDFGKLHQIDLADFMIEIAKQLLMDEMVAHSKGLSGLNLMGLPDEWLNEKIRGATRVSRGTAIETLNKFGEGSTKMMSYLVTYDRGENKDKKQYLAAYVSIIKKTENPPTTQKRKRTRTPKHTAPHPDDALLKSLENDEKAETPEPFPPVITPIPAPDALVLPGLVEEKSPEDDVMQWTDGQLTDTVGEDDFQMMHPPTFNSNALGDEYDGGAPNESNYGALPPPNASSLGTQVQAYTASVNPRQMVPSVPVSTTTNLYAMTGGVNYSEVKRAETQNAIVKRQQIRQHMDKKQLADARCDLTKATLAIKEANRLRQQVENDGQRAKRIRKNDYEFMISMSEKMLDVIGTHYDTDRQSRMRLLTELRKVGEMGLLQLKATDYSDLST